MKPPQAWKTIHVEVSENDLAPPVEPSRGGATEPVETPGSDVFVFPASLEQMRYWTLDQLDADSTASNMAIAARLEGEVNDVLVERSIQALVQRHEALRTTFQMLDGSLCQVISESPHYRFSVTDLRLPAASQDTIDLGTAAQRALEDHSHARADLALGPALFVRLIHLSDRLHYLAFTMHHIVCDGWSNGILIRDFAAFYTAFVEHREPTLPALPFQFADFSVWQRQWLESDAATSALDFWRTQIQRRMTSIDLPTDGPRLPQKSYPGRIESALLPVRIASRLKAYCRSQDATMHQVLLAALQALLARYTNQSEFLLGSTIANRTQPGMEDIVGRFAHPQVILADVSGNPSFAQLLSRVAAWSAEAYVHQDLPFSCLMEEFQLDASSTSSQFLEVYFVYQKAFMQPQQTPDFKVVPVPSVSGGVNFDLLVSVVERDEGPRLQIEYNTVLFRKERILGLIRMYFAILEAVLDDDSLTVSQMPLDPIPNRAGFAQTVVRDTSQLPQNNFAGLAGRELASSRSSVRPLTTPSAQYLAPRDPLETSLTAIWEEILGVRPIGIRTSFFQLGGYSLMIVRLFGRINKSLGTSLPITTIFNAPTIEQLADIIRGRAYYSSLVPVRTQGVQPPVFMIHSYLLYRGIPAVLGDDYPFYGLRELDTDRQNMTVAQRAAVYLDAIRSVQPSGPYRICGWCAAGPLAVETARQILASGEQIGALVLFDSWRPGYAEELEREHANSEEMTLRARLDRKFRFHRRRWRTLTNWQRRQYIHTVIRNKLASMRDRIYLKNWATAERLCNFLGLPLPHFMHNVSLTTLNSLKEYRGVEPYPGAIALIRARECPYIPGAKDHCGWDAIASGGVQVFWAPGDHESMFLEPHLQAVGELLRQCLDKNLNPNNPKASYD